MLMFSLVLEGAIAVVKLINELDEYMPERYIVVLRELTKKFEESWRGFPKEIKDSLNEKRIKGEFVIVIAPDGWSNN